MKKIISLLLVLCMVIGLLAGVTMAAGHNAYALVLGAGKENQFANTVSAQLLFQDGTVKIVTLSNVHDVTGAYNNISNNCGVVANDIVTFVIGADGTYTLTKAANQGAVTNQVDTDGNGVADTYGVGNGVANIDTVYANNKTVFTVGVKDLNNVTNYSTYIGISNVPTFTARTGNIYYAMNAEKTAVGAVFCIDANVLPLTLEQPMMLYKTGIEPLTAASPTNSYYTVAAVVNGEITNVKVASCAYDSLSNGINLFSMATTDMNGNYASFGTSGLNTSSYTAFTPYVDGVIGLDGTATVVAATLPAYVWNMTTKKLVATTVDTLYALEGTFHITRAATLAAPINAIFAVIK